MSPVAALFASSHPFQLYALVSAILVLQLVLLAGWTGTVRTLRKAWINPEDQRTLGGKQVDVDHPDVQRVKRAHMNALENAVPFFVIGFLFAVLAQSETGAKAYFFTFLGARIAHSIFYLFGKQPFRTLSFAVGVAALVGMAVQVIMTVV